MKTNKFLKELVLVFIGFAAFIFLIAERETTGDTIKVKAIAVALLIIAYAVNKVWQIDKREEL